MAKGCTNIEQSRKLIEAGIDVSTADYYITPKVGGYVVSTEKSANSVPSWSVVALYAMLPTSITYDGKCYDFQSITERGYHSCHYVGQEKEKMMNFSGWDNLVDMLTEVVLWFLMVKDEVYYENIDSLRLREYMNVTEIKFSNIDGIVPTVIIK